MVCKILTSLFAYALHNYVHNLLINHIAVYKHSHVTNNLETRLSNKREKGESRIYGVFSIVWLALEKQVTRDLSPIWGRRQGKVSAASRTRNRDLNDFDLRIIVNNKWMNEWPEGHDIKPRTLHCGWRNDLQYLLDCCIFSW